jgi:hypothetical protein
MYILLYILLCRYPQLRAIAVRDYGTVRKMAKRFGPYAQYRATQERSSIVSKVKEVFFQNDSPFALVKNVLLTDLNKKQGIMKLTPALVQSGVPSVDALRKLIRSKKMYQNPVLYDLFCSGIESGNFKYNPQKGPTTVSRLLTVRYEASIRSEMWWAISEQRFRHNPSTPHILERVVQYDAFRELVIADRAENEPQAANARHPAGENEEDDSGEDSDDKDELDDDPKFY